MCTRRTSYLFRTVKIMATTTDPQTINHAFFMSVRTTPDWLLLIPKERFAFLDDVIRPILVKHPTVTMRYFDAEAFTAQVTDVLLWETADVMAYQAVVEDLRETLFWGTYFEVVSIVPAIENGYAIHYGIDPA